MAKSYYKTIHGVRYDRALMEAVDERILGQGEGRITKNAAEEIIKLTKDGGRVTETELNTLKYIRENYNFTPKAAEWFAGKLPDIEQAVNPDQLDQTDPTQQSEPMDKSSSPLPEQDPSNVTKPQSDEVTQAVEFPAMEQAVRHDRKEHIAKSYYKTIHGVRYDRALLEAVDERILGHGEGRISKKDAEKIVKLTKDGGHTTETELNTLKYIRENYNLTPKAAEWFAGKIPAIEQAVSPDQIVQDEPTQQSDPLDQSSSPLAEQDLSSETTPQLDEVTPTVEFPAMEQAVRPDQFDQVDPTQQSDPLDQSSSPLAEQDPSSETTPQLDEVTPTVEFPAMEQAVRPDQFDQIDPTQQSDPLDQSSSPLAEQDPSPETTPQSDEVTQAVEFPAMEQAVRPDRKEHIAKSYYKTIHGVRYDRALLEAVDERILGQGEGRISKKDAEKIVKLTKDGGRITETELNTLKYIRENYNFTPKAAEWFAGKLPDIEQAVNPDQIVQAEPAQQSDPLDQSSSPLPEQDPSTVTKPQSDEVTPAVEFPAMEQAVRPGQSDQTDTNQQSDPLDQSSSPLAEQDPSSETTPQLDDVTPSEEFPAMEQAVRPDQFDQIDPTQQSDPLDQSSSSLAEQDPSSETTPQPDEVTPAMEFHAMEQAVRPDQFDQADHTQQSEPLDQDSSPLPELEPSTVTTSQPDEGTPAVEFPVMEQAVHPDQFDQTDPTQQSDPLDQTSPPPPELEPSTVTTSQSDEGTPEEKPSKRIQHLIWGVLLFVTILIGVVLYQGADKEIGTLESKLAAVPSTQELEQQVSVLQSERSALQTEVRKLNQKIAEANSDQEQLQKRLRAEQDRLASALAAVPSTQSERSALQTQVSELNQKAAEANSVQAQLQKGLRAEQDRLVSANSEISNLRSEVQALRDRAVQAEQIPKSTKTGTDPAITEVLRVLKENAFTHSDLFKVTSTKLEVNLEGFRTNENILLDEHYELLNRLIPLLKPLKINLKLIGHTYSKGGYNEVDLFLSRLPALVVSQYITEKLKFPRERIHVTGRADLKSVVENTSREVPFKNRRVELHLEYTGDHPL